MDGRKSKSGHDDHQSDQNQQNHGKQIGPRNQLNRHRRPGAATCRRDLRRAVWARPQENWRARSPVSLLEEFGRAAEGRRAGVNRGLYGEERFPGRLQGAPFLFEDFFFSRAFIPGIL